MNFKDLNLKTYSGVKTVSVLPGQDISVLQYLPIEDKNDLITVAVQNSNEAGFINPVTLQMYFELYTVYLYTDMEFTDDDKVDAEGVYNILKSNGIIDAVINSIPEEEWNELYTLFCDYRATKEKYGHSVAGVLNNFIENLAPNAQNAAEIINGFNPEMFQNVLAFAQAANGGRPIN